MTDVEIHFAAKNLLIKIHVITGWILPASEILTILIDVFSKKLIADYGSLNVDEIEHAFIKAGPGIEDWGKEMNLNLLDKVLVPYIDKRFELSKEEERKLDPPLMQKIYSDEEITNERRGEIEIAFQAIKRGYRPLLHSYFKEILQADGLLNEGETVGEFFVRKVNSGIENIYLRD